MHPHRFFERCQGSRKRHDGQVKTVCQECSTRCGLVAYLNNGVIVDIHGDDDHPVSRGRLCARGLAFVQGLDSPDRIITPAFRKNSQEPFETSGDWEKALDGLAEHLRKIKEHHGPESLWIVCDPEADLDFAVGAARFAALLGTPHLYHPFGSLRTLFEFPQSSHPFSPCSEWAHSRGLLLIEADPATTHPMAFGWALEAQQHGAKLIVADARFTRTMSKADLALRIRPDTGNILGLALMKKALEQSDYEDTLDKAHDLAPDKWAASLRRHSWEDLERAMEIPINRINELSDFLRVNSPVTIITGKRLSFLSDYGIWPSLVSAMAAKGSKGSAWYPLNTAIPPLDPNRGIGQPDAEKGSLSQGNRVKKGLRDLARQCQEGHVPVKAVLCSGEGCDDFFSFFNDLSSKPDLIACFGSFPQAVHEQAHMIFPSTLWAEKSGLCFSDDRTVHWAQQIVEPRAGCRSGLDFWLGLARRFGWPEAFPWTREDGSADHQSFYHWLLEGSPVVKKDRGGQIIGSNGISEAPFGSDNPETKRDEPEALAEPGHGLDTERFPLFYQKTPCVSRSIWAGNYWPWTQKLEEEEALQINPETARALGIENGDSVILSSPAKTMEGRAWLSRMVPVWMVSSPRQAGGDRVLVHRKDRTVDEALTQLKALLS